MIHVAVGILLNQQSQVLIAERPPQVSYPGLWEFPGGKVEPHETDFDALKREFREEIGIEIHSAELWFQISYDYPDRSVLLDIWLIKKFTGEPYGAEGQLIRWVKPIELTDYQFPEANEKIIQRLLKL